MKDAQANRTDEIGRAFKGSQLQIQIYVNRRQQELNEAIVQAHPTLAELNPEFRWVSPLESCQCEEYRDEAFLSALGLERFLPDLKVFWPPRGPVWDGLACLSTDEGAGVLLVEAKSYPEEMYGSGCQASAPSLKKINAAFDELERWLGVKRREVWIGSLYQSANRLAHLYLLREKLGVPTWLANVCFTHDPHASTNVAVWRETDRDMTVELGLAEVSIPWEAKVYLPARQREKMVPGDAEVSR